MAWPTLTRCRAAMSAISCCTNTVRLSGVTLTSKVPGGSVKCRKASGLVVTAALVADLSRGGGWGWEQGGAGQGTIDQPPPDVSC